MNAQAESPSLPLGWRTGKAALDGVDLGVAAQGRGRLAIGAAILGVLAGWRTFVIWKVAPSGSVIPWFGITLGLLRLYTIDNGRSHLLIERDEKELRQLEAFISFHTGWPIRPLAPPPGGVSPL